MATPLLNSLALKDVPHTLINTTDPDQTLAVNDRLQYKPAVAVEPKTVQHVSDAVTIATEHGIKVQAYGGGHSYGAFCLGGQDGAMVIYMRRWRGVEVGKDGVARVGAGCRLGPLARALWDKGKRAIAHGNSSTVGVAGHALHGGFGHFSRAWGLALDHIVAIDVVQADGTFVHADRNENSDLYYAMRGAGDSFGIAVYIYFQTRPAPEAILHFEYHLDPKVRRISDPDAASDVLTTGVATSDAAAAIAIAAEALDHIEEVVQNKSIVDRRLSIGIFLGPVDPSSLDDADTSLLHEHRSIHLPFSIRINGTYLGTVDDFSEFVAPELRRGLPLKMSVLKPYANYLKALEDLHGDDLDPKSPGKHNFFAKSVAIPESGLSKVAWTTYLEYIYSMGAHLPYGWFSIIDLHGGADSQINNKDVEIAAYNVRSHMWVAQHYAYTDCGKDFPEDGFRFVGGLNRVMAEHIPEHNGAKAYINYVDPSLAAEEAHDVYYGKEVYQRLKAIKEKLDPQNVFTNPHSI